MGGHEDALRYLVALASRQAGQGGKTHQRSDRVTTVDEPLNPARHAGDGPRSRLDPRTMNAGFGERILELRRGQLRRHTQRVARPSCSVCQQVQLQVLQALEEQTEEPVPVELAGKFASTLLGDWVWGMGSAIQCLAALLPAGWPALVDHRAYHAPPRRRLRAVQLALLGELRATSTPRPDVPGPRGDK